MSGAVPQLRFPGFERDWEARTVDDFANVISGHPVPGDEIVEDSVGMPLLRGINITEGEIRHSPEIDRFYSNYTHALSRFIVQEGDIVLGMDGSKVGRNVATVRSRDHGAFLIQRVARLRQREGGQHLPFAFSMIFSERFHKYVDRINTSSGIPHISLRQLKEFPISAPCDVREQQKIADFLSTADAKLNALRRKKSGLEAFKTGLMQKIFSQEIRFTREDGSAFPEWEEKRLGEVLKYEQPTKYLVQSTDYKDCGTPVLTAGKTFILGYTDERSGIYNTETPVIIFDDFTTSSHMVDFPFKVKSSAMKILSLSDPDGQIAWIHECLKAVSYEPEAHQRHWISMFADKEIPYPHRDEQRMIVDALSAVDGKIAAVANQITHMETFKKGLLQQMFV